MESHLEGFLGRRPIGSRRTACAAHPHDIH
jgi:hypothetical protein